MGRSGIPRAVGSPPLVNAGPLLQPPFFSLSLHAGPTRAEAIPIATGDIPAWIESLGSGSATFPSGSEVSPPGRQRSPSRWEPCQSGSEDPGSGGRDSRETGHIAHPDWRVRDEMGRAAIWMAEPSTRVEEALMRLRMCPATIRVVPSRPGMWQTRLPGPPISTGAFPEPRGASPPRPPLSREAGEGRGGGLRSKKCLAPGQAWEGRTEHAVDRT